VRFVAIGILVAGIGATACSGTGSTGSASQGGASAPAERLITIPAGTSIPIVLETAVASDTSHAEEPVQGRVAGPVLVDGVIALADGATVSGVVTEAKRSGKVKGGAHVAMRFDSIALASGVHYPMQTAAIGRTAKGGGDRDALEIAAPAVGGAIIGGLIGGGKGAAIGALAGGGAGTAVVLSTRGDEVGLGRGAALTLRLAEPLTVKIGG
jgi:hypothetical protein